MQLGMIGLGRMGMNMTIRLTRGGHKVIAFDASKQKLKSAQKEGAAAAQGIEQLVVMLRRPRAIWLMIPAGRPVDDTVDLLSGILAEGDVVIDGGNSFYKDDIRREELLGSRGIHYLDVGVSGGVWGLEEGYCIMAGGDKMVFSRIEPIFRTLAPKNGYLHCGPAGAGHFVKMIHNAIEYAMMAAYGEGFSLLHASPYAKGLNLADVAGLWKHGSVIRSWLLELAEQALRKDGDLSGIRGYVEDSGEGRWAVQEAVAMGVPVSVTALSLFDRFRSREEDPFSDRLIAALRNEFGGHAVVPAKKKTGGGRKSPS